MDILDSIRIADPEFNFDSIYCICGDTMVIIPKLKDLILRYSETDVNLILNPQEQLHIIELGTFANQICNLDCNTYQNIILNTKYVNPNYTNDFENLVNKVHYTWTKNIQWFAKYYTEIIQDLQTRIYIRNDKINYDNLATFLEYYYYILNENLFLTDIQLGLIKDIQEHQVQSSTVKKLIKQVNNNLASIEFDEILCDYESIVSCRQYCNNIICNTILTYNREQSILALI